MIGAGLAEGARVLFPASNLAGSELSETLEAAGARVERVEAYTTRPVAPPIDRAADLSLADAVTFTSPSSVEGWRRGVGNDLRGPLAEETHFVAIGPTTSARLGEYGIAARTPDESTFEALVECLCTIRRESRP
jgi:uroporphyrinogen-III synthase